MSEEEIKKPNAEQAAFPTELKMSNSADKGLTKLEYFTAAILQGLIATADINDRKYIFGSLIGDTIFLAKKAISELDKTNQ